MQSQRRAIFFRNEEDWAVPFCFRRIYDFFLKHFVDFGCRKCFSVSLSLHRSLYTWRTLPSASSIGTVAVVMCPKCLSHLSAKPSRNSRRSGRCFSYLSAMKTFSCESQLGRFFSFSGPSGVLLLVGDGLTSLYNSYCWRNRRKSSTVGTKNIRHF